MCKKHFWLDLLVLGYTIALEGRFHAHLIIAYAIN